MLEPGKAFIFLETAETESSTSILFPVKIPISLQFPTVNLRHCPITVLRYKIIVERGHRVK